MTSDGTYLEGLKVLDLSRILAGPLATLILADLGAEVLKIEPPEGDTTRRWGPPFVGADGPGSDRGDAAYYHSINRDKASLVLDLKTEADRARLAELARRADVLVSNATPKAAERLGLPPILDAAAERAVVLEITGYRGERREEAGYDLVLQAEAGWMGITGPADSDGGDEGEPHRAGVAVVDVLTGMMAANGILAALVRRERRGVGAHLGLSLFQTALWSLVNVTQGHLASGEPCRRWGNRHPNLTPYELFHARDGALVVGVGTDRQYEALCDLLGIDDPELRNLTNAERLARRDRVHDAVAGALAEWSREEILAALRERRIPTGPVLRPDQALASTRRWNPGAVFALEHESLGPLEFLASPLEGDGLRGLTGGRALRDRDATVHRPPPALGEGGEEMARRWLGT